VQDRDAGSVWAASASSFLLANQPRRVHFKLDATTVYLFNNAMGVRVQH
jgi:hypothetical protein